MNLETEVIVRYGPVFSDRLWWDETPKNLTANDRVAPFGILQQVGGKSREYVDQSEPEWITARVQLFAWGARRMAVSEAMLDFAAAVRASNDADWIAEVLGEPVGDANEVLDLRGLRQDFSFTYRNPRYQG